MYTNEVKLILYVFSVNLAGEFMDCVLAVTMNWMDERLKWAQYGWGSHQISSIRINPNKIWTPHIDVANRLHDFSPSMERKMFAYVRYDGKLQKFAWLKIIVTF